MEQESKTVYYEAVSAIRAEATGDNAAGNAVAGETIESAGKGAAGTGAGETVESEGKGAVETGATAEMLKPEEAVNDGSDTEIKTTQTAENDGTEPVKPKKKKKKAKEKAKAKPVKKPKKVIICDKIGVRFNMTEQKVDNLKEYFIRLIKKQLRYKEFWALRDITFHVRKGERVGILGLNGAGKSTLLKCIAGVLKPTEGSVTVNGSIVPLLELGAGFDKDYTGAENIFLYGSMLGYSRAFIREKFDAIVQFSELGDFINVPVKNYSSGMKARLGFSIATVVEPDILILDEVLSVGDAKFKKKSAKKLNSMMKKGVTVLLVSHSSEQVLQICDRAIILDHGKLIASGKAKKICAQYEQMISK